MPGHVTSSVTQRSPPDPWSTRSARSLLGAPARAHPRPLRPPPGVDGRQLGRETTAHGRWAVATDLRQEPSTCPSPSLPHLTPVRAPTSRQGTGCVTAGADAATTGRSARASSSPGRSPSGLIDRSPASTAGPPRLRRRFPASIRSGAPLKSTHRRAARRKRVRRNRTGRAPSGAASTTPRPGPGTSGASTRRGGRPGRHRHRRQPARRVRRQGLRGPGGAGSADRRGGQCPLLAASFRAHARRARLRRPPPSPPAPPPYAKPPPPLEKVHERRAPFGSGGG